MNLHNGWYICIKDNVYYKCYWHYGLQYFTIDTDNYESKGRYAEKYFDSIEELNEGYFNVHIDTDTGSLHISNSLYKSLDEAKNAVLHTLGFNKIGTFRVEYNKSKSIINKS